MTKPKRWEIEHVEQQWLTLVALPVKRDRSAVVRGDVDDFDVWIRDVDGLDLVYTAIGVSNNPAFLTAVTLDDEWSLGGPGYTYLHQIAHNDAGWVAGKGWFGGTYDLDIKINLTGLGPDWLLYRVTVFPVAS